MEFQDAQGRCLPEVLQEGTAILEEASTYRIALQLGDAARAGWRGWLGELELKWEADTSSFLLQTGYWVGTQSLRIHGPHGERHIPVEVHPRKTKLHAEAWVQLLRELDAWLPGSTVGREGGRHGEVGNTGCDVTGTSAVLGELVPAFMTALEVLATAPRESAVEHWNEIPVHAVRQADRNTLRWLVCHPQAYQCVQGVIEARQEGRNTLIPARASRGALDHPANRYVAWLARQVVLKLRDTARCVRKTKGKNKSLDRDLEHWCESRARWLETGADAVESVLRHTPLGTLTPEIASDTAILTLVDNPAYGRVHAIGQTFLLPRFKLPLDDALIDAPVRPSYELYELWTFLAVQRLMEEQLKGLQWTGSGIDKLRFFDQSPNGASYTAAWEGRGTLELHFNLPFAGFLSARKKAPACWSISGARRPDVVMAWKPLNGPGRWICLDAKYRTHEQALAESFESVHLYRDALRWQGMSPQGRCAGALLLVPARNEASTPWFEKSFRDEHGAGIICLTPGQPPPAELFDWIQEQLQL
ncbi:DUF2357 domain-containing protein [Corallococcus sp. AB038B]|uniref:DUF2357 domain-containing protein n=2 Tax=Corallococcus TaxID=83461 RepID=UPI000EF110EC|nr:DUF2357 domain-containing protein [Corallococcus sp. AB038B]RKH97994.1 DUF2357 domain-containing protein [Corallococcus sp. AB038B]